MPETVSTSLSAERATGGDLILLVQAALDAPAEGDATDAEPLTAVAKVVRLRTGEVTATVRFCAGRGGASVYTKAALDRVARHLADAIIVRLHGMLFEERRPETALPFKEARRRPRPALA